MEKNSLFTNDYIIQLRDVDFKKRLKLSSLFHYLQDTASLAVDDLGIGINTLKEKFNVTWILIRIRVEIIRNPELDEQITIETYPQKPKAIELERDFIVKDQHGNIIIRAISTWIIMDIEKRRIRKSSLIDIEYPPFIEERAIDCELGKIAQFDNLELAYDKSIGYNDIDFNGHLNNIKYIDFIMECYSLENHSKYVLKTFEINYINEVLPEDTLLIYKDSSKVDENKLYIEGKSKNTNKLVFKSFGEVVLTDD